MFDKLKEECGVFAIYGSNDASIHTALGLHALQHRGQEAAGRLGVAELAVLLRAHAAGERHGCSGGDDVDRCGRGAHPGGADGPEFPDRGC